MKFKLTLLNVFIFLFGIYIFIIPFEHTAAIKNISLYLSMGIFIYLVFKKEILLNYKNMVFILFSAIFIEAFISIGLNQVDIQGSLKELRTNLFEQIYILLVVLSIFNTKERVLLLIKILITSYLIITFLALIEVIFTYFNDGWSVIMDRGNRGIYHFFCAFARLSVIYLPIVWGYYLYKFTLFPGKEKLFLTISIFIAFVLTILYQSSSISVFLIIALIIPVLFKLKLKYSFLVIGFLIISFISMDKLILHNRIENKVLSFQEYNINNSYALSGRIGLWKGVLLTIDTKKHLLFGYGYGWKKLSLIAGQEKYRIIYKQTNNRYAYGYFQIKRYGKNNTHNTYLEILFESGIVGLLLFLLLLFFSLFYIFKTKSNILKFIILPVVISYILNSLMNGYWEGNFGKIIVIFFALSYTLYRINNKNEKNNLPSS